MTHELGAGLSLAVPGPEGGGAGPADDLATERLEVERGAAERAGLLRDGQDDAVAVELDLDEIALLDPQRLADAGGDDNPSEVIDLSADPRGSHQPDTKVPPPGAKNGRPALSAARSVLRGQRGTAEALRPGGDVLAGDLPEQHVGDGELVPRSESLEFARHVR